MAPDAADPDAAAFDRLCARTAHALTQQLFLLTCERRLALRAVDHAFRLAWQRWPEVAGDPQPEGWLRTAACEYALSPWWRPPSLRHGRRRRPRTPFLDAVRRLPAHHRMALLLYDGLGLDLPDAAAEAQATTPAMAGRVSAAHAALARSVPGLVGGDPDHPEFGAGLTGLLRQAAEGLEVPLVSPERMRLRGERRARRWTIGVASLIVALLTGMLSTPTPSLTPGSPGSTPRERVQRPLPTASRTTGTLLDGTVPGNGRSDDPVMAPAPLADHITVRVPVLRTGHPRHPAAPRPLLR
ncbi:hypothetical protein GCM10012280_12300 [Wenjunlia tyrosinilytica]|uniref:Uncharacterized protein n=2 Tax=Wenjunlia tyrosinilytica TaxID=1544741 RepID=A0A918DUV0_9ACTN|nr:hypothetical protein GCM10012280_12300 [Wenjunlia tyrosinilytica]